MTECFTCKLPGCVKEATYFKKKIGKTWFTTLIADGVTRPVDQCPISRHGQRQAAENADLDALQDHLLRPGGGEPIQIEGHPPQQLY